MQLYPTGINLWAGGVMDSRFADGDFPGAMRGLSASLPLPEVSFDAFSLPSVRSDGYFLRESMNEYTELISDTF